MITTITANQFLSNFLDLYPNENWDELPSLTEDIRFARRLLYVDRLLGEKFNGDNSAELFGLSIWTREDSWIPFDESFINPWIHNAKSSPLYGHPLRFSTLCNKMGKNNAIIAEWLLKTIRLSHDLYGWYTFDIKEIIPGFINGYDWSVQNTFKNNLFMDFIRNSPYSMYFLQQSATITEVEFLKEQTFTK